MLQCQIHCTDTRNESSIKWYKDEVQLDYTANQKYKFEQNNKQLSLQINNPNANDSGKYKCQFESNGNVLKSISHYVDVPAKIDPFSEKDRRRYPANKSMSQHTQTIAFESFMKNITIEEGNRVKFLCGVIGQVASVDWFKDNQLLCIETDRRYRYMKSDGLVGLEIFDLAINDSGFYTCTVNGPRNSITSSSKLTVYESFKGAPQKSAYVRPSIRSQLSDYIAKGKQRHLLFVL